MKYYKLIKGATYYPSFTPNKIYPEGFAPKNNLCDVGIYYRSNLNNGSWIEVPAGEYFVQEGKMPEYFAIKMVADNPLWGKYIDWLSNTYFDDLMGCVHEYYGFDSEVSIHAKLKYFKNNPVELTLEQWDKIVNKTMEEEFVLPEEWWIDVTDDNINILKKWWDHPPYNTSHIIGMVKWIISGRIKRGYNLKRATKAEGSYDFGKEITTEQFIKYVLKQEVMEDNKELVGYECPVDLWEGDIKKGAIFTKVNDTNYSYKDSDDFCLPKEYVETWKPVYQSKTLTFGGYNVIFEKVTSGVRITCNWETGTLSQVEAIYNYFKPNSTYFKFGSQEVKSVTYTNGDSWNLDLEHINPIKIKIGCTTGTWEEFVAIYEKAKSML